MKLKGKGTLIDLIDLDRASVPSSQYSTREISVREPQPGDRTKSRKKQQQEAEEAEQEKKVWKKRKRIKKEKRRG